MESGHFRCHVRGMKAGLVISLVALAHLSGCAKNEPRACTPPDAAWRRPNFNQDAETIRNRVTLDRAGQLYWNGYAVSNGDFAKMLNAARLAPQADLYLEAEMGAPCRDLDRVRQEVSNALGCHDAKGRCVEGLPDFQPHPFR
ncbi:hypothetical protein GVN23_25645 [Sphingobium yanoikuyae]|nr:hypothetical protein [Sphingobium yanoikuyae]